MSQEPLIVPTFALPRSILLPASFAGCGMLLGVLFVVLMGCGTLLSLPGEVENPVKNAVLCDCQCDPPSATIAVPWKNFIAAGPDDATQGKIDGNQIVLGQNTVGLRFLQLGVPRFSTITSAKITFTAAQLSIGTATFGIHIVDQPDAKPFGPPLDVYALQIANEVLATSARVRWPCSPRPSRSCTRSSSA